MGSFWGYRKRKDTVMGLDIQITKLQIQGELSKPEDELKECSFHNENMKQNYDKNIRNCLKGICHEDKFTKATELILKKYFQYYQHKLVTRDNVWEILQYKQQGFFKQHKDRQLINKDGLVHVAMEILIPPKSLCQYQGGYLTIYQDQDSFSHPIVRADEKQWTHIILPLGIFHQVSRVYKDSRITYNKKVIVEKKEDIQYSVPKTTCAQQLYN